MSSSSSNNPSTTHAAGQQQQQSSSSTQHPSSTSTAPTTSSSNPAAPGVRMANLAHISAQVDHLKAKYANNAEAYKRNTGHTLDWSSSAAAGASEEKEKSTTTTTTRQADLDHVLVDKERVKTKYAGQTTGAGSTSQPTIDWEQNEEKDGTATSTTTTTTTTRQADLDHVLADKERVKTKYAGQTTGAGSTSQPTIDWDQNEDKGDTAKDSSK